MYRLSSGLFVYLLNCMSGSLLFGVNCFSCREQFEVEYNVFEKNLADSVRNNSVYQDIQGQSTLDTRYLTEDIPMGLVPFVAIGKLLGLPTARMEAIIGMGQLLLDRDLMKNARRLKILVLTV